MKVTVYSIILAGYVTELHVRVSFQKKKKKRKKTAKRQTAQTIKLLPKGLNLHVGVCLAIMSYNIKTKMPVNRWHN